MKRYLSLGIFLLIGSFCVLTSFKNNTHDPEAFSKKILARADIIVGGSRPWDIQVHNKDFYACVLTKGSVGLGESYMAGWWDCEHLDQFFFKILRNKLYENVSYNFDTVISYIRALIINLQSQSRAFEVGERHYDLGNDLFKLMLDKYMIYSCGYWKNAKNLDEAQEAKLKLICDKLYLKPGMKIIEIGCGWGGFAYYAAKNYQVEVVGVTVSKEQAEYARDLCKNLPVEIRLQDYRALNEPCDRIVSVGMFEHVGHKNYPDFIDVATRCLKPDGLILLHTIGSNMTPKIPDPWITKYIFPNGILPSIKLIGQHCENKFVIEDWHNFGADYDPTLMAWFENFDNNWPRIQDKYGQRFYRMWKYYLLACAGLFRARDAQLWQVVLSPKGVLGGYVSVR